MRRRLVQLVAFIAGALVAAFISIGFSSPAFADLLITVDKTTQRMTVALDGSQLFDWPVSTGLAAYDTPNGSYMPFRMEKEHFSKEWDDAPMPHSVFFTKRGHAIHGTTHKNIGRPASHGCVRLEPKNAELLFGLVTQETIYKTKIIITGEVPAGPPVASRNAPQRNANAGFERGFSGDEVTGSLPPVPPAYVPPAYGSRRQQTYQDPYQVQPQYQPRDQYVEYRGRMVRMFRGRDGRLYYEDAPSYARPRYEPRYVEPRRYGYEVPRRGYYDDDER